MKPIRWIVACGAVVLALTTVTAFAQEHGRGRDKDKRESKRESKREFRHYDDDRDALHNWYVGHRAHLPRGLAKRDELPPGLENQLVARGTLPPGLRKKFRRCPGDLGRLLPPPPPDCEHVLIGGRILLINRRTFLILDVFRFVM
jgi:Ni/Co efflux regulator RcnB